MGGASLTHPTFGAGGTSRVIADKLKDSAGIKVFWFFSSEKNILTFVLSTVA
jgi:hypothetical protein